MKTPKSNPQVTKRHTIKKLAAAGSIATIGSQSQWLKPMVQSTILPTHAQSSPTTTGTTTTGTTTTTGGPIDACRICSTIPTGLRMGVINVSNRGPDPFIETDQGTLDLSLLNRASMCFENNELFLDYLGCSTTISLPFTGTSALVDAYVSSIYPGTYPFTTQNYNYFTSGLQSCLNGGRLVVPGSPGYVYFISTAVGATTIYQVAPNTIVMSFRISVAGTLRQDDGVSPFTYGGGNVQFSYSIQTFDNNLTFGSNPESIVITGAPC